MNTSFIPTKAMRAIRMLLGIRVKRFAFVRRLVENRVGLEIGGPSSVFDDRGILPVYSLASRIDNCIYAQETLWGKQSQEGLSFRYHPAKPPGFNFIREATDLAPIANSSYDFVLGSHSLEHIANPVKAIKEWIRVTKPGATFIILLPHYKYTFDRRRQVTPVSHMFEDFERNTSENDETHFSEILRFHDLALHPAPINHAQLQAGILDNFRMRCAHHHVFDENNSSRLLIDCGLRVESVQFVRPYHIVLLAMKCLN